MQKVHATQDGYADVFGQGYWKVASTVGVRVRLAEGLAEELAKRERGAEEKRKG